MTNKNPFRYFKTSPEITRLAVMMYVRFPLSLRNVEDLLHERGIDICHETVRYWWNRFGPLFEVDIRKDRNSHPRSYSNWQWHLDEVFVKINGETHYLWRAVDHEGEVLESFVTKRRDRKAALAFLKKAMKRYGTPKVIVTDRLKSYRAAMKVIGRTIGLRILISRFDDESELCPCSGSNEVYRNLPPFILPSATTSTFKDISSQGANSKLNAMLHLSDGSSFVLQNTINRSHTETSSHWSDTTLNSYNFVYCV